MKDLLLPGELVALTPGKARGPADLRGLVRSIGEALEAGLPAVLLREPELCDRDLFALARETLGVAQGLEGRWIGVHDSVHVALAAGANGVHLGFRSLPPAVVRSLPLGGCAVGFSAHENDDPRSLSHVDYAFFGPVRPTPSKEGLLPATGFDALASAAALAPCPLLALGGMRPEDAGEALASGAAGLAVLSGILGSPDPGGRTVKYLDAIARGKEGQ